MFGGRARVVAVACADGVADAGGAYADALRAHGLRRVTVVTDALVAVGFVRSLSRRLDVDRQGVGARVAPDGPLVIATTPEGAVRELRAVAGAPRPPGAVYLAPWLLDARVLAELHTLRLPPVSVAATSDPMSPAADRYRALLAVHAPGAPPTAAGLAGFTGSGGAALRLYAATPIGFLPGPLEVGHQHSTSGWFPGGTLVPVSAPVTVPGHCTSTTPAHQRTA